MKKLAILLLCTFIVSDAKKIKNLSAAKSEVQEYYSSGEFDKDVCKVTKKAWKRLSKLDVKKNSTIVFDIDDCMVSSFAPNKEYGFGNLLKINPNSIFKSEDLALIPPVKELYDRLVRKGFKIVLLSSRPEEARETTKKLLAKRGYNTYERLVIRNKVTRSYSNNNYKEGVRNQLAKEGYDIVACIGDQRTDLLGANVGMPVKIPNYMYEL